MCRPISRNFPPCCIEQRLRSVGWQKNLDRMWGISRINLPKCFWPWTGCGKHATWIWVASGMDLGPSRIFVLYSEITGAHFDIMGRILETFSLYFFYFELLSRQDAENISFYLGLMRTIHIVWYSSQVKKSKLYGSNMDFFYTLLKNIQMCKDKTKFHWGLILQRFFYTLWEWEVNQSC